MFLAIVGGLAITAFLIYVTLGNLAVFAWSDENVRNTIAWNWRDLWLWWAINVAVAVFWWFTVGVHLGSINISFG